jgi:hypothetical protein
MGGPPRTQRTEEDGELCFARSDSGFPNRSRLCESRAVVREKKKSLRHEPPVRSGRCPPFRAWQIFPPSWPGKKSPHRAGCPVAAKRWCGLAVVVDQWHSALGTTTKRGPVTKAMDPSSLVAHKIPAAPGLHISLDVSPLYCGRLASSSTTSCMYPLTCQSQSKSKSQRETDSCRLVHYLPPDLPRLMPDANPTTVLTYSPPGRPPPAANTSTTTSSAQLHPPRLV